MRGENFDWDFMFDPPAVFEIDERPYIPTDKKRIACEWCEDPATHEVREETRYGWGRWLRVCSLHKQDFIDGELLND